MFGSFPATRGKVFQKPAEGRGFAPSINRLSSTIMLIAGVQVKYS